MIVLAVSAGVLVGALPLWAVVGDAAREFEYLQANALCVLEMLQTRYARGLGPLVEEHSIRDMRKLKEPSL